MKKVSSLFLIALAIICSSVSAQTEYKINRRIALEGNGGWDYITVDGNAGRIYTSHGSVAQIVDIKSGTLLGTIPDTKGIHGIALAPKFNKGFTSNGGDSSVTVFDLKTFAVIGKIKVTGQNPDAIIYDSFSKKLFTFNGRSSNATVIDAENNKVLATIPLEGKPEFPQTDGKGKIYVNIEDKSLISVINVNTLKVEKSWSIAPGEEPSGLALDNETHRLFAVCGNKLMIVVNAETGKVITTLPIGDRCDGVAFDPGLKRAYSSNGEGTITVVQESKNDSFKVLETITTQNGARTITLDKTSHRLYLPTAEYDKPVEGQRRPPIKPNTFTILEIELTK
jgi:YVTN family beta-propeller protein